MSPKTLTQTRIRTGRAGNPIGGVILDEIQAPTLPPAPKFRVVRMPDGQRLTVPAPNQPCPCKLCGGSEVIA